ncbi:MAG TPA: tyrosine--tRNA ligase [Candidatus Saccharimonadales bacterium]|nr:tyrosine--tRNA ligase [Candidatus Saccharimonadales bacterium]
MTLSEELQWRGFVNQTTFSKLSALDSPGINFYFGVDPSADSMQIGNLAAAMMVKTFAKHGHNAFLLVGGATGLIGDPDGKAQERNLQSKEQIEANKRAIAEQYKVIFGSLEFTLVDNYDWFEDMHFLDFLRDVGKHVPMRQMLARDFVQTRLGENGSGISYAEFSYVLIQAYDFLHLHIKNNVTLQLCGSDQWGNSIAGVDLIRRVTSNEAHVYSMPLIINKATGKKFGKTEDGAVWLDRHKTSPTKFYQFWVNVDDAGVEDYLKVYTELEKQEIEEILRKHHEKTSARFGQTCLAEQVTSLVHGTHEMEIAKSITRILVGDTPIGEASDNVIAAMRNEIPYLQTTSNCSLIDVLTQVGLATSKSEARRLLDNNAISINGSKTSEEKLTLGNFHNNRLLIRRGKAFKDSALVELQK